MPVKALIFTENMEKAKVRRCLFGRPDHESLRKDLDEQLKQAKNDMRSSWNFDPDLDKPLDGRYEWTLLKEADHVPLFYSKEYRPTRFRKIREIKVEQEDEHLPSRVPSTPVVSSRVTDIDDESDLQRENEKTPEFNPPRQSKIDEHFVKVKQPTKRKLSMSSDDSGSEDRTKSRKIE